MKKSLVLDATVTALEERLGLEAESDVRALGVSRRRAWTLTLLAMLALSVTLIDRQLRKLRLGDDGRRPLDRPRHRVLAHARFAARSAIDEHLASRLSFLFFFERRTVEPFGVSGVGLRGLLVGFVGFLCIDAKQRYRDGHEEWTQDQANESKDLDASEEGNERQQCRHLALSTHESRAKDIVGEADDDGAPIDQLEHPTAEVARTEEE